VANAGVFSLKGALTLTKLTKPLLLLAAMTATHPAAALTIVPDFDSSITGAADASQVEGAIDAAIGTIDSLYSNAGSVGIVFTQASGSFLGESESADYNINYGSYTAALTAASHNQPTNTILSTAIANLASGNKPGVGGTIYLTSADGRVGLGLAGFSGCFNSGGTFVNSCGQAFDGVVTLTTSYTLNYGTTPVSGEYSAVNAVEHEINEILGGGGQGSMLNTVANCQSSPTDACTAANDYTNDLGVLDLYRYSAPGTPSLTTSGSASSYFSVNGGVTDIIGFNQNSTGDYADYSTDNNVQSAFSTPGGMAPYDATTPEFAMMESIGYAGVVPEPASMAVFAAGLAGLGLVRRRK
jgi:hypothetical protein